MTESGVICPTPDEFGLIKKKTKKREALKVIEFLRTVKFPALLRIYFGMLLQYVPKTTQ